MGIHYLISIGVVLVMTVAATAIIGVDFSQILSGVSIWGMTLTGILVIPVCLWFMNQDEMRRNPLKRRHGSITAFTGIWMLVLGGSLGYILNMLLGVLQVFEIFPEYSRISEQVFDPQPLWVLLLCAGIVAPIAEEVLFRGLVHHRLSDYMRGWKAILLSAVLFGIYHGNMVQGIYATLLGIAFAVLMERFKSLWVPILLHIGANCWTFVFGKFAQDWIEIGNGIPVMLLIGLQFIIVFFSGVYLLSRRISFRY